MKKKLAKVCINEAIEYQWYLEDKDRPVGTSQKPKVQAVSEDPFQLEEISVNVMKKYTNPTTSTPPTEETPMAT